MEKLHTSSVDRRRIEDFLDDWYFQYTDNKNAR